MVVAVPCSSEESEDVTVQVGVGIVPRVVAVRRSSRHDGPGLRSVVFLKGCALRCDFCHNPESQDPRSEIAFVSSRCIHCKRCIKSCPNGAIRFDSAERIRRKLCQRCGACTKTCPPSALKFVGRIWQPAALAEVLRRDWAFYLHSGGGVTFSGGECLLYPGFLAEVITALRPPHVESAIHIAVQTGGHFLWDAAKTLLSQVDLVYFDLKLASDVAHRAHTGASNRVVIENLHRTAALDIPVRVRIPVVPGVTDHDENLHALATVALEAGIKDVGLTAYNPAGLDVYPQFGRKPPQLPRAFIGSDDWRALHGRFRAILEKW